MIDIEELSELFGGDMDGVRDLLDLYLEHCVPIVKDIEVHYAAQDTDALRHDFHTLFGSLSNLKEQNVELIQECELLAQQGQLPDPSTMELLYSRVDQTTQQVKAFLE